MPVITHRRVSENRGGRRRLSSAAVSGYTTGSVGMGPTRSMSPRATAYPTLRTVDCKPSGAPPSPTAATRGLLSRSLQPQANALLIGPGAGAAAFDGAGALRKPTRPAPVDVGSSGLPSPSASPNMRCASQIPAMSLSLSPFLLHEGRAFFGTSGSEQQQRQGEHGVSLINVTSAASGKSSPPPYAQRSTVRLPLPISAGACGHPRAVDIRGGGQSGIFPDGGMYSPPEDSSITMDGAMDGAMDGSSPTADSDIDYDDDDDLDPGYTSEFEERDNELLPTSEQLIFSQAWSTWPTSFHHLYSGSQFSGSQSNGKRSYEVDVSLQYVDMGVPELCGHFTIRGLTSELPTLTTYFDAQIVGTASNSFVTNQWEATVDTDRTHWSFFPAFMQYRNRFSSKDFNYKLGTSDKFVFMRWKERFIVPNYKLSKINGASYDGFYYVCYDREEAAVTGFYYHKESDQYQCLKLKHKKQTSFAQFELA
ncbi:GID complex subunit 4, VID24 [Kickxella alabastrina]|uniref:GID complex subunit 4, VID24 n=1 Tax=Kickxella alabastrina TaxID=61397 RepID=A0ACC1I8R0_9FUNG|nr:GID complex subunit 4, VID24 [Kickxella alabastrina]